MKGKRIKSSLNDEIPLPEEAIQHIQSFMTGKEAARTTVLSKSWNNAWLTRPRLDIETLDFYELFPKTQHTFEEFVKKTMKRYLNLNLKIDSFRLSCNSDYNWDQERKAVCHELIVDAMKMGATAVQLERWSCALPQEVLGSETLLKLSIFSSKVGDNYNIRCSRLKSLTLTSVNFYNKKGVFKDLITCCISMEELSLSQCPGLELSLTNLYELHKLRRLLLDRMYVDSMFFTDFASRFSCLKHLSIDKCRGCTNVQIASTSLEAIYLKTDKASKAAKFDVPNICKLTYSCFGLPSHLSIDGPSREWEFDISIAVNRFHRASWFQNLKKLLKKFRLSIISLCVNLKFTTWLPSIDSKHEVDVEFVRSPLVVESLMIKAPSEFYSPLMVRSLGAFRPKFITAYDVIYYVHMLAVVKTINNLRKRVIQELFVSNWEDKFGPFGLKQVNVEIYEHSDTEWRPLGLKRLKSTNADSEAKVRFQLIWED